MDLSPALAALITDEWANYEAVCRESTSKNRPEDYPPDPTLGSLKDSVEQMPDDIVEAITGAGPDDVRAELERLLEEHGRDAETPEVD